ncbi:dynein-related AAA-type ATPase, putative, partial [Hepatocystis sp. ex Piliocolobus tephrosceles]
FNQTLIKPVSSKLCFNINNVFNHSFLLTSVHRPILYEIMEAIYNKESLLLIGDTGVGKTALVDYISKLFNKKLHVFVFSEQSEASDLIGNYYPFNMSVKTNELLNKFQNFVTNYFAMYTNTKELNLFFLKLKIMISEKKYSTCLRTCYQFVKYVMTTVQNCTESFNLKAVK